MGFAGYVSVCVQLSQNKQTTKKNQTDKHTRKETTKTTKENTEKNTNGNVQNLITRRKCKKATKQNPSDI
jgi:hypothetical protein